MQPVKKSLWSLHLTVILLGATGLFSKLIPLDALDITFGRSIIACIALLFVILFQGEKLRLNSLSDYGIAVLLGVIMAAHWVTYFASMQYSSVSVGMIALFTFPVITVLLEPFFEDIKLVWQDILSAVIVVIGIFLIVPETSIGNNVTRGILLGIVSALLYSLRNLLHHKYFKRYSGPQAMAYQTLIISICLVGFVSEDMFTADYTVYLNLVVLGTICTALPHALIAFTLIHLRAKTFSLIACMQPFYGVIFAILVLNETLNLQTLLGGLMVISAAFYETFNMNKLHTVKTE
jgi:drug/metabolite transporter (DMT)-like permease